MFWKKFRRDLAPNFLHTLPTLVSNRCISKCYQSLVAEISIDLYVFRIVKKSKVIWAEQYIRPQIIYQSLFKNKRRKKRCDQRARYFHSISFLSLLLSTTYSRTLYWPKILISIKIYFICYAHYGRDDVFPWYQFFPRLSSYLISRLISSHISFVNSVHLNKCDWPKDDDENFFKLLFFFLFASQIRERQQNNKWRRYSPLHFGT